MVRARAFKKKVFEEELTASRERLAASAAPLHSEYYMHCTVVGILRRGARRRGIRRIRISKRFAQTWFWAWQDFLCKEHRRERWSRERREKEKPWPGVSKRFLYSWILWLSSNSSLCVHTLDLMYVRTIWLEECNKPSWGRRIVRVLLFPPQARFFLFFFLSLAHGGCIYWHSNARATTCK